MLTKPILASILPFDSTTAYTVTFSSTGGSQVTANQIQIIDNITLAVVYTSKVTSFAFSNTIPINTLTNGRQYKITVQTFDVLNAYSVLSDSLLFWCYANPTVVITNIISGAINAQDYIFQGSYTGTNIDTLQSYRYLLYDANTNLIQSFSEVFSTALTQEIAGNENGITYYLVLLCMGQHGQQYTSGLIKFIPNFIAPYLVSALTVTNNFDTANVTLNANITESIGTITSGTVPYQTNEWADLITGSGVITFQQGVNISSNFYIKIYLKNLVDNVTFLKIICPSGYIIVNKYNNQIHAFKYIDNITNMPPSHFVSNTLTMISNNTLCIGMWYQYDLVGLQVALI